MEKYELYVETGVCCGTFRLVKDLSHLGEDRDKRRDFLYSDYRCDRCGRVIRHRPSGKCREVVGNG